MIKLHHKTKLSLDLSKKRLYVNRTPIQLDESLLSAAVNSIESTNENALSLEYSPRRLKREAEKIMINETERIYEVVQKHNLVNFLDVNGSPLKERRFYRPTVSLVGRFNAIIRLL